MYKHKTFTDEEIKELVVKAFEGKIFTSYHCKPEDIGMIFMPIMFINSPPSAPREPELKEDSNIKKERKNKLNHLDSMTQWKKDMEHYNTVILPDWERDVQPKIIEFLDDVGMIYESNDKALPRGINGYPMFSSCGFLSKSDASRFLEVYGKYEKIREKLDKEF